MEKRTYYIITKFSEGSGIQNDNMVRKIVISEADEEFDQDEFVDFEEYVQYCIEEECGADEQHFGTCLVLTEDEFDFIQKFTK